MWANLCQLWIASAWFRGLLVTAVVSALLLYSHGWGGSSGGASTSVPDAIHNSDLNLNDQQRQEARRLYDSMTPAQKQKVEAMKQGK